MKIKHLLVSSLAVGMALPFSAPAALHAEDAVVYAQSDELSGLKNQESALKKELEAARKKKQEAQKALDALNGSTSVQDGVSALDFYRWLQAKTGSSEVQDAITVLEDTTGATQYKPVQIASATHIGAKGDATSLENFEKALNMIDTCNSLRASDNNFRNLQPLKVSPLLMAISAKHTNYSRNVQEHCQAYYVAENLAWTGYGDPYRLWYDQEKAIYDSKGSGVTGHYTNICDKSYGATGTAISGTCFGQVFYWGGGDYTVTTDQMRSMLSEFKSTASSGSSQDTQALEKARKALEEADKQVSEKEKALQDVQAKIQKLEGSSNSNSSTDSDFVLQPGMKVLIKPGQSVGGFTNDTSRNIIVECNADQTLNFQIVTGTPSGIPSLEEVIAQQNKPGTSTSTNTQNKPGSNTGTNTQNKPGSSTSTNTQNKPGTSTSTQNKPDTSTNTQNKPGSNTSTNTQNTIQSGSEKWIKKNGKWTCEVNGKKLTGNQTLVYGGKKQEYYFLENGEMYTGWRQEKGCWVYYVSSGEKKKNGWIQIQGSWYIANASGSIRTGWVKDKDGWYYMQPQATSSSRQGSMVTSWLSDGGQSYYLDKSGKAASGWKTLNGKSYYFYPSKHGNHPANSLAKNTWIGVYYVNGSGEWVKDA